jgi:hypothetical protein
MKQLIFCTYLLLVGNICIAQPQAAIDYVSLYKTCDSLNGLKKMAALDKGLTQQLNQIDKKTTYHFFAEALYFIEQNQFPEAAIFFHVGLVRQNYYIGVNNNYAPNEDWQYAESMKSISAKKLIPFLQSNADNYLQVLKVAIEYCEKNDYDFSSKLNYPDKYQNAINKLKDLQADILKNKEQFKKDWEAERARLLAKKV